MRTTKDLLDPAVDVCISYLCGRHACSLLHSGGIVIGTVYDDRIVVSSDERWPLPRGVPPAHTPLPPHPRASSWREAAAARWRPPRIAAPTPTGPLGAGAAGAIAGPRAIPVGGPGDHGWAWP